MQEEDESIIFTSTTIGSTQVGWVHERDVPAAEEERHREQGDDDDVRYSAAKYAAKRPPPYSVL
jgi:hypothetical protein